MNGHYSRFAVIMTTEPKFMDSSEPEQGPKLQDHFPRRQIEEKNGGVALGRSFSSASPRFDGGGSSAATATLQAAVKRAFSMRRSSSVREGYWRIHDETGEEEEEEGEGEFTEQQQQGSFHSEQRKKKKKQRQGKFLRTCKRIFGF